MGEEGGEAIRVITVDEHGLVGRHNRAQGSRSNKIHEGDLIVDINGISANSGAMLQECKARQVLTLTIIRGIAAGSPVPSTVPSPPGGNHSGSFIGSADGGELDRVLAEVASTQQ